MTGTSTRVQDARHVPLSKVDRLRQDAAAAAQLRALMTHPDVVALRVESIRSQVDALMWVGIVLGLAFTMVNVQTFAADGAAAWSLPWCAAWLLDPMVSLVLIAVLRAEQITARYQVAMTTTGMGPWVRRTKVFAFAATYTMNTWQSWAVLDVAGIVLHSVPPTMVYLAAETGPILRDRLTEAVFRAADMAAATTPPTPRPGSGWFALADAGSATNGPANGSVNGSANGAANTGAPVREQRPRTRREQRRPVRRNAGRSGRTPFGVYLEQARAAYRPGVVVTPAWVRSVTGCSRGTSQKVADALNAETTPAPGASDPPTPAPAPVPVGGDR